MADGGVPSPNPWAVGWGGAGSATSLITYRQGPSVSYSRVK